MYNADMPLAPGQALASVYALKDPRTGAIRYVGATKLSLPQRLAGHLSSPTGAGTRAWLSELSDAGLVPAIELLEVAERANVSVREAEWINRLRSTHDLVNGFLSNPRRSVAPHYPRHHKDAPPDSPDLILHMRLKPGQKARWEAAATRDRRTLSDWVRLTLDDASEKKKE